MRAVRQRAITLVVVVSLILGVIVTPLQRASAATLSNLSYSTDSAYVSTAGVRYNYGFRTTNTFVMTRWTATVPTGTDCPAHYMALVQATGNGASTPDSGATSITGAMDIRVDATLTDWTPAVTNVLVAKYTSTGNQRSYMLRVGTGGALEFWTSATGSSGVSNYSSVANGIADGTRKWIRVTFTPDNGSGSREATFYTSPDGSTWTQLGATATGAATTIFDSSALLQVGTRAATNETTDGKIHYAEVRNGIGGTVVAKFDPSEASATSAGSWTASGTGEVWTIDRNGTDLPADISCDLTINSQSGLGSGTSQLRLIDGVVVYRITNPVSVSAGTNVSLSVTGITNTATPGSYPSTFDTYDNSTPPGSIDNGTTSALALYGQLTSTSFTPNNLKTLNQGTRYDWGFTTAHTSTLSKVVASAPNGTTASNRYVDLPGYMGGAGLGNYLSTPDTPVNSITGDLDIRVKASLSSWTPAASSVLVDKRGLTTGTDKSYGLDVSTSGNLVFTKFADCSTSTTYTSTVATGLAANATSWVKATWKQNNGSALSEAKFYLSNDGSTWTQLGTTVTSATVSGICNSAQPLEIGSRTLGTQNQAPPAKFYYVELRSGIDGPVVNKMDPNNALPGSPLSWVSGTGETWTITRAGTVMADNAADLTVNTNTGLGAGTAIFRIYDNTVTYTITTPASVSSGTSVSLGLTGFINPQTAAAYTTTLSTYDNSGTPVKIDGATTGSATFAAGALTSATWATNNVNTSNSGTRYDYGFTTATTQTLNKVTMSVPSGTAGSTRYLATNGVAVNYAYTADTAANSVTGDIDLRVHAALDDWSSGLVQRLISKWYGSQKAYFVGVGVTGLVVIGTTPDGSTQLTAQSTAVVPFADGGDGWIRATLDVDNGSGGRTATFYTSTDGSSWTQLGSAVTTAGTTSIFDSTTYVEFGTSDHGSYFPAVGKLYSAEIRNGIGGTLVNTIDANASAAATSPSAWASSTGETWTLTRTGTNYPIDLVSDLTASSITGIPTGGTATLRFVDGVVDYRFATPTSVAANTAATINVTGITNTATVGTYTSQIRTHEQTPAPMVVDSATTASVSFKTFGPTSLAQYKSNGTTPITTGAWTDQSTVVFKTTVSDSNGASGDYLCIELQAASGTFTNSETQCGVVSATNGNTATVTISGLTSGTQYHWQARLKDGAGYYSPWVDFGSNALSATDVAVDALAPASAPSALGQFKSNGTTPIPGTTLYNWDATTQGWTGNGGTTVATDSSIKRSGGSSLKVSKTSGVFMTDNSGSVKNLSANGPTLSLWVYAPSTNAASSWNSSIAVQDTGYGYTAGPTVTLTPDKWTLVTYTPPMSLLQNMRAIAVNLNSVGGSGTQVYYVDDLQQGGGTWTNETSIVAKGTVTDAESQSSLCIETKLIGSAFTNSEDSCGTAVNSGSVATVNATGLSNGSQYHWQVRNKDQAGNYSTWAAYGGNTDTVTASPDVSIDTGAPVAGTVYDGTNAGQQTSTSGSSLSQLSANWASFSDAVSGVAYYQYSIGTSAGGTQLVSWTSTSDTTVTKTGLTLQSGTTYYFNVKAVDFAGNESSVVSSSGQMVAPSLTFGVGTSSLSLGNLTSGNSYTSTGSISLTTSTNAHGGYSIAMFATQAPQTSAGALISSTFTGSWATPASWTGTGFGYTSNDTSVSGSNRFSTASLFAGVPIGGPGDVVADNPGPVSGTAISNESFLITTKIAVPSTQAAGTYRTTVVFTAIPTY